MLTVTDNAMSAIRMITTDSDVAPAGGLRIACEPDMQLSVALAELPADGDQVVDEDGARLFIEERAAQLLDGLTLDVSLSDDGSAALYVAPTDPSER